MSKGLSQLTIDGNEVPLGPQPKQPKPLSDQQQLLLKEIEAHPSGLRPIEIGTFLHGLRGSCPQAGQKWNSWKGVKSIGCCPYASTDGANFLHRLERRKLVFQSGRYWFRLY